MSEFTNEEKKRYEDDGNGEGADRLVEYRDLYDEDHQDVLCMYIHDENEVCIVHVRTYLNDEAKKRGGPEN